VLKLSRRQVDHEDIVAQGYAALRRAALHLARGDDGEAGDLLHDTFVRFLLLRPRIDAIGNLDGYLYTMLRNVYLSRQRQYGRRKALVADAVDVDLLAAMVDEPEPSERLRMRDDLVRLVAHACERTRVSRGASAWVLRCVHGYYPTEIARVMKMAPRSVDRSLHVARREALEELRRPSRRLSGVQRWRDLHVDANVAGDAGGGVTDPFDTLQLLRAHVFDSVDGACLTDDQLAELYRPSSNDPDAPVDSADPADPVDPVGALVMSHIVACAECLDRINRHLDLTPLKMRDPVESSGTRRRRGGGGPDSPAGPGSDERGRRRSDSGDRAGLEPLLRRTRDTLTSIVEHTPRELRIAANGFDLGALPVAGVVTVQELAVRLAESLAFIEIFDERGALVCYWPAQVPHAGSLEDHAAIELADGRLIELQVSLTEDCPRLRVRYTDPRMTAAATVDAGLREVRRLSRSPASTDDARHVAWWQWWRWIVPSPPSPRVAIGVGALIVLWSIFIGPTTTWAAIEYLGRAAAAVMRTLMTPEPPAPPASAPAPTTPAAAAPAVSPPRVALPARTFSPSELTEIEMAARVALHGVRADLGEDITLRATPGGVVVQGVVGGAARRDAIARALADLDGARVRVQTAQEAAALARTKGTRTQVASQARGSVDGNGNGDNAGADGDAAAPVRVEAGRGESAESTKPILEALTALMPAPAARAAFVNATLAHADDALARAWALRRLADRYQPSEVASLSPRSSQALAGLVNDHTAALRTAVDALVARVTPLAAAAGTVDDASAKDNASASSPQLSIEEMFTLVNAWHTDAHALLAGVNATVQAPAADDRQTFRPNVRELLSRLHRIQDALKQSRFADSM
jgi:DNA-directed RNA polymerase specialized sigma24 family protein